MQSETKNEEISHSGFAAVVGRPSCGKSTFLNTLCGHKASIVSPVPQTTRNCIRAIYTEKDMQIVFLDTPEMHKSARAYNRKLSRLALEAVGSADAVLCLLDLSRDFGEEERNVLGVLRARADRAVIVCNKADLVSPEIIENRKADVLEALGGEARALYIASALKKEDVLPPARALGLLLPPGPRLYPADCYTDQTQRHRIAEIIREKIFLNLKEEIPHAACVLVEELRFNEQKERILARAMICVECESQKGILIGARGAMIRELGTSARADIEKIFGYGADIFLRVEVRRAWRKDKAFLRLLEKQYEG